MSSDPFQLESPPRSEPRRRRVRRELLRRIADEHSESARTASREPDSEAFNARAYWVVSGLDLIDVHDPLDGFTLESVVALLSDRVATSANALKGSQADPRAFWRRDLTVWNGGRLVATVRFGTGGDGKPVVTIYLPA